MACIERAGGAGLAVRGDQVVPANVHVSPRLPLGSAPPNRTTWLRAASNARPCCARADGDVVARRCVQFTPSHSQVSPKKVVTLRISTLPPNRTTRLRSLSQAIAMLCRADGRAVGARSVQVAPSHSQVSFTTPLLPR